MHLGKTILSHVRQCEKCRERLTLAVYNNMKISGALRLSNSRDATRREQARRKEEARAQRHAELINEAQSQPPSMKEGERTPQNEVKTEV
jgi:hypothetical protein